MCAVKKTIQILITWLFCAGILPAADYPQNQTARSSLAVSSDLQKEEFVQQATIIGSLLHLLGRLDGAVPGDEKVIADIHAVLKEINTLRRQHHKEIVSLAYIPEAKALIILDSQRGYVIYREKDRSRLDDAVTLRPFFPPGSSAVVVYPGLLLRPVAVTDAFIAALPQGRLYTEYDQLRGYDLADEELRMIREKSAENGFEVVVFGRGISDGEKRRLYEQVSQLLLSGKIVIVEGDFIAARRLYYFLAGHNMTPDRLKNLFVLGKDLQEYDRYFTAALSDSLRGRNIVTLERGEAEPPLVYRNVKELFVEKDDQVFQKGTKITCAVEQASHDMAAKVTEVNNTAWEEKELQETEEQIEKQLRNNPTGIFALKIRVDDVKDQIKPKWKDAIMREAVANDGWIIVGVIFSTLFHADRPEDLPDKHHLVVETHHPKGNSLVDPKVGILPQFQGLGLAPFIVGSTDDYAKKMELDNVWAYSRPSFFVRYIMEQELKQRYDAIRDELLKKGVSDAGVIGKAYESDLQVYIEATVAQKDAAFRTRFAKMVKKKKSEQDIRAKYMLLRKEEYREACRYNPLLTLDQFFSKVKVPNVLREYIWVSVPPKVSSKLTQAPYSYEEFLALKENEVKFKAGYIKYPDRERDKKYYDEVFGAETGSAAFLAWLRDEAGRKELYDQLTEEYSTGEQIDLKMLDKLFKKFLKETSRRGYDLALRVLHSKAVPVRFVPGGRPDDYLESNGHNFIMEYYHVPSIFMIMNHLIMLPVGTEFSAGKLGIPEKKLRKALEEVTVSGFRVQEDPAAGSFRVVQPPAPLEAPMPVNYDPAAATVVDLAA